MTDRSAALAALLREVREADRRAATSAAIERMTERGEALYRESLRWSLSTLSWGRRS